MTHVLGLDLSKVGLGQALEAMAEAWLDAQGVEAQGSGASEDEDGSIEPIAEGLSDSDRQLWREIEMWCGEIGEPRPRAEINDSLAHPLSMEGLAAACRRLERRGLICMRKESFRSEDGRGGGSRWVVCPYWMGPL